MREEIKLPLLTALLTLLSFVIRLDFLPWYQRFGFYQGDIWYFFTSYGELIRQQGFFPFDYPIGYLIILKITSVISLLFGQYNYPNFLYANALLIVPAASLPTWLLYQIAKVVKLDSSQLIFYFVLSPSLFIYSTINYDIFPIVFILSATYFLLTNKLNLSAIFLSLATVTKLYPALFLPLIIFYLLSQKISLKKIGLYLILFMVIISTINLPFALSDWNAWAHPFSYQLANPERDDPTTLSYYLTTIGLENFRSYLWFSLIAISWIISWIFYRAKKLSAANLLYLISFTAVAIVLGNHVYTPQYFLWFLPFLALINKPYILLLAPFDYLNASTRFFYFRFRADWPETFQQIHNINIIFLVCLYLLLAYTIKVRFKDAKH